MKTYRKTIFKFTEEEVETVRNFWEFLSYMEDWEYEDLINNIDEDMQFFFDGLDGLLHFMENNME